MYVHIIPLLIGVLLPWPPKGALADGGEGQDVGNSTLFTWSTSEWSECHSSIKHLCCRCYRRREVSCVYIPTWGEIPPFYCSKYGPERPAVEEPCSPCVRPCVLSTWGEWSQCSGGCAPEERYRTRKLLHPGVPWDTGHCGPLVEFEQCPPSQSCGNTEIHPLYTWRTTPWTSCRKIGQDCGRGIQYRKVECVNQTHHIVGDVFCQHYVKGVNRPSDVETCSAACDCKVSDWSEWEHCSVTCHRGNYTNGYQIRRRSVVSEERNGGLGCPPLQDVRACGLEDLPQCPKYKWTIGEKEDCRLKGNRSLCGQGIRKRYVFCSEEDDPSSSPVHKILCINDAVLWHDLSRMLAPSRREACQVPCPQDCQLGEWQNWSSCTKSCGGDGVRIRTKPILMETAYGGEPCGARYQTKQCQGVPCIWWHIGRWSRCFLDVQSEDRCGEGVKVRSVYCLSSLDEVLSDDQCSVAGDKPSAQKKCQVPCPGECDISDWSSWSTCSVSCGTQGGIQSRTRSILSDTSPPGSSCMPAEELNQTQICNQQTCKKYLWQVTAWSDCTALDNTTTCDNSTGTRTRRVYCEMEPGYPTMQNALCDAVQRPEDTEVCEPPCPDDCRMSSWSEWSSCSHTCGTQSQRLRRRRVLRWPAYGGKACPLKTDRDGSLVEYEQCTDLDECQTLAWQTSDWGRCVAVGECGYGVRRRNVTCVRRTSSQQKIVPIRECLSQIEGTQPEFESACFKPCDGDCSLSPWSEFGPCPTGCTSEGVYTQRSRTLLYPDRLLNYNSQCPHLSKEDFAEMQVCDNSSCHSYNWEVGPWTSCVVHNTPLPGSQITCGSGIQRRHVICKRDDGIEVEDAHCELDSTALVRRHRACLIDCPQDCVVSEWMEWTSCSTVCGPGLRQRFRESTTPSANGGIRCASLVVNSTCTDLNCDQLEWYVSEWGDCRPSYNLPCGEGKRWRDVMCRAGNNFDVECEKRQRRPADSETCDVPCIGDCQVTEWGEWSKCDCNNKNQSRSRSVVRDPLPSGKSCGALTESQGCTCRLYRLDVGPWTTCVLDNPERGCGSGRQKRAITCLRDDDVHVSMTYCDENGYLRDNQDCETQCLEHCQLTPFSSWSQCTTECGASAYKTRLQTVISEGNSLGVQCPPRELMFQNTTCHTRPCFKYTWRLSKWSECLLNEHPSRRCGMGLRHRDIECVRNDGEVVEELQCLLTNQSSIQSLAQMSQERRQRVNLHSEEKCGTPCPGDCLVSDWSEFGPCYTNCTDPRGRGTMVRSRVIIRPATGVGNACPPDVIDLRICARRQSQCPMFEWQATGWSSNDKRKVHCMGYDGQRVSAGCLQSQIPPTSRDCSPSCGEYAYCREGRCTCEDSFTGDGFQCLPVYGCEANTHCIFNTTICDLRTKSCVCPSGALPDNNFLCPVPKPTGTAASSRDQSPLGLLFLYILLGSALALVVVTLCLVAFVFRKKKARKSAKKSANLTPSTSSSLMKIDNMGTLTKKELNTDSRQSTLQRTYPNNMNQREPSKPSNAHMDSLSRRSRQSPAPMLMTNIQPNATEMNKLLPKNNSNSAIFGDTKHRDKRVNFSDEENVPRSVPRMGSQMHHGIPPPPPPPPPPDILPDTPRSGYDNVYIPPKSAQNRFASYQNPALGGGQPGTSPYRPEDYPQSPYDNTTRHPSPWQYNPGSESSCSSSDSEVGYDMLPPPVLPRPPQTRHPNSPPLQHRPPVSRPPYTALPQESPPIPYRRPPPPPSTRTTSLSPVPAESAPLIKSPSSVNNPPVAVRPRNKPVKQTRFSDNLPKRNDPDSPRTEEKLGKPKVPVMYNRPQNPRFSNPSEGDDESDAPVYAKAKKPVKPQKPAIKPKPKMPPRKPMSPTSPKPSRPVGVPAGAFSYIDPPPPDDESSGEDAPQPSPNALDRLDDLLKDVAPVSTPPDSPLVPSLSRTPGNPVPTLPGPPPPRQEPPRVQLTPIADKPLPPEPENHPAANRLSPQKSGRATPQNPGRATPVHPSSGRSTPMNPSSGRATPQSLPLDPGSLQPPSGRNTPAGRTTPVNPMPGRRTPVRPDSGRATPLSPGRITPTFPGHNTPMGTIQRRPPPAASSSSPPPFDDPYDDPNSIRMVDLGNTPNGPYPEALNDADGLPSPMPTPPPPPPPVNNTEQENKKLMDFCDELIQELQNIAK